VRRSNKQRRLQTGAVRRSHNESLACGVYSNLFNLLSRFPAHREWLVALSADGISPSYLRFGLRARILLNGPDCASASGKELSDG
jgi:hypothetical protein